MTRYVYHRQSRTQHSEEYEVMEDDTRVGHLDLHFGTHEVYGTLVVDDDTPEETVTRIIDDIDENLVLPSDVPRDNFLVRVFAGREVGLYSDELRQDEYVADGNVDFDG